MKTLLEAIKQHPDDFISTLQARSDTTPSECNKRNHMLLSAHIAGENWENVSTIITDVWYQKPLEGVVFCLDRYSEIDNNIWHSIVELLEEGKLV